MGVERQNPPGYIYDKESANAARDDLESTLRMLAKTRRQEASTSSPTRWGTWVTMEALRQLALTGDRNLGGKLGDVVLASPDIDVDVFKSQMRRYGKPDRPFFLMLSSDDRALKLSGIIAGNKPRVGDYGNAADLAEYGVIVVDLSREKGADRLNHTKFADNPELVKLLGESLKNGDLRRDPANAENQIAALTQGPRQHARRHGERRHHPARPYP